ncbi:hypothetical protein ACQP1O_38165 [Nocardia sp. CA-151230]|uniref:hypothetical protein n=1 Tax=Nocardia sp. CA-151230 TaxID=3239982 RepID=UPI003D94FDE3
MKRGALKIAAVPILPVLAFLVPAGPATADPLNFDSAQVTGSTPGCSGTVEAQLSANQGQTSDEPSTSVDSSATVMVNFTPDTNTLDSLLASPGSCEISTTVTMQNLDNGTSRTETKTTEYDSHYGWHAAFFTLEGSGQVSAQVSTNPSPSQLTIDVPAPI